MTFLTPYWAILIIPLIVFFFSFKMPSSILQIIRIAILVLLIIALCRPIIETESKKGTVIVISDHSLSMPNNYKQQHQDILKEISDEMPSGYELGVISFGADYQIEQASKHKKIKIFKMKPSRNASNLNKALSVALNIIPKKKPGRILLLTDGNWTGIPPFETAAEYSNENIPIDYLHKIKPSEKDLYISSIGTPDSINPNEGFMISATVNSPFNCEANYTLLRNNTIIAKGKSQLDTGVNLLHFRDQLANPGNAIYKLKINPPGTDSIPKNNIA